LAGLLLSVTARRLPTGMDFAVQQRLFLIEIALIAVADRLLAVTEGLLEPGDALIGV
jgi:hypothetical protein